MIKNLLQMTSLIYWAEASKLTQDYKQLDPQWMMEKIFEQDPNPCGCGQDDEYECFTTYLSSGYCPDERRGGDRSEENVPLFSSTEPSFNSATIC